MAHVPGRYPFGEKQSSSLVFEEFVPPSAWTEDSTCHYLLVDLPGFKKQELKLQVDNQTHILVSGERQVTDNKYKRFEQKFELPKDADIEKITGKLDGEILYISVPKKVKQEPKEIKHDSIPEPPPAVSHEDDNDKKSDTSESNDEQEHKEIKHGSIPAPSPVSKSDSDSDDDDDDDKKSDANETEESDNKDYGKELERKIHRTSIDDNWGQDAELILRLAMEKLKKNKKIVVTAIFAFTLGVLVTQKFQSNGH